jgi:HD-GYP domain-containing protein (c-di-GMP phosphodiesterase class II)
LDTPMRVLAVADVYEALTADRPYRGPLTPAEALAIIDRDVPHKLDAGVRHALEVYLEGPIATAVNRGLATAEA